jgi:hypothetical protein
MELRRAIGNSARPLSRVPTVLGTNCEKCGSGFEFSTRGPISLGLPPSKFNFDIITVGYAFPASSACHLLRGPTVRRVAWPRGKRVACSLFSCWEERLHAVLFNETSVRRASFVLLRALPIIRCYFLIRKSHDKAHSPNWSCFRRKRAAP